MNESMNCNLLNFVQSPCIAVVSVVGVIIISLTIMVIVLSYWLYKIKKKISEFQLYLKEENSVELIDTKNHNQAEKNNSTNTTVLQSTENENQQSISPKKSSKIKKKSSFQKKKNKENINLKTIKDEKENKIPKAFPEKSHQSVDQDLDENPYDEITEKEKKLNSSDYKSLSDIDQMKKPADVDEKQNENKELLPDPDAVYSVPMTKNKKKSPSTEKKVEVNQSVDYDCLNREPSSFIDPDYNNLEIPGETKTSGGENDKTTLDNKQNSPPKLPLPFVDSDKDGKDKAENLYDVPDQY